MGETDQMRYERRHLPWPMGVIFGVFALVMAALLCGLSVAADNMHHANMLLGATADRPTAEYLFFGVLASMLVVAQVVHVILTCIWAIPMLKRQAFSPAYTIHICLIGTLVMCGGLSTSNRDGWAWSGVILLFCIGSVLYVLCSKRLRGYRTLVYAGHSDVTAEMCT